MVYALKVARAKILVTVPASLEKALTAAKQVGIPICNVILIQGVADGFKNVQELIQQGAEFPSQPPHQIPAGTTNKELCGYLNFSSGTTGLPKAVSTSKFYLCLLSGTGYALSLQRDRAMLSNAATTN